MRFLKTFILLLVVSILSFAIYSQVSKDKQIDSFKAKRIPCMEKVTSFEKVFDKEEIKILQNKLHNGNYTLKYDIDKSTYMTSTLFNFVNMEKVNQYTQELLNSYVKTKDTTKEPLKIEYIVFENDKEDPKKKSKTCKLYRGYVVFKYKNTKNKVIYQSQIDFLDPKGEDIPQTIKCSLEAFITYNK